MRRVEGKPDLVFETDHMERIDADEDETLELAEIGDLEVAYNGHYDVLWVKNGVRATPPAESIEVYEDEGQVILENGSNLLTYDLDELGGLTYGPVEDCRVDEKTDIIVDNMDSETGEWNGGF